jgi:hypothetical protein
MTPGSALELRHPRARKVKPWTVTVPFVPPRIDCAVRFELISQAVSENRSGVNLGKMSCMDNNQDGPTVSILGVK